MEACRLDRKCQRRSAGRPALVLGGGHAASIRNRVRSARDAPVLLLKGARWNNPFAPALYSPKNRPMTFVTAFQSADTFAFGQGQQGGADLRAGPG